MFLPKFTFNLYNSNLNNASRLLDKDGDCVKYISESFPDLSDEKSKGSIFDGPQIKDLIKDPNFVMPPDESYVFVLLIKNFLRNLNYSNSEELVQTLKKKIKRHWE